MPMQRGKHVSCYVNHRRLLRRVLFGCCHRPRVTRVTSVTEVVADEDQAGEEVDHEEAEDHHQDLAGRGSEVLVQSREVPDGIASELQRADLLVARHKGHGHALATFAQSHLQESLPSSRWDLQILQVV